jgi:hypothetical protein
MSAYHQKKKGCRGSWRSSRTQRRPLCRVATWVSNYALAALTTSVMALAAFVSSAVGDTVSS